MKLYDFSIFYIYVIQSQYVILYYIFDTIWLYIFLFYVFIYFT